MQYVQYAAEVHHVTLAHTTCSFAALRSFFAKTNTCCMEKSKEKPLAWWLLIWCVFTHIRRDIEQLSWMLTSFRHHLKEKYGNFSLIVRLVFFFFSRHFFFFSFFFFLFHYFQSCRTICQSIVTIDVIRQRYTMHHQNRSTRSGVSELWVVASGICNVARQ